MSDQCFSNVRVRVYNAALLSRMNTNLVGKSASNGLNNSNVTDLVGA